jgi:hypothetical protein
MRTGILELHESRFSEQMSKGETAPRVGLETKMSVIAGVSNQGSGECQNKAYSLRGSTTLLSEVSRRPPCGSRRVEFSRKKCNSCEAVYVDPWQCRSVLGKSSTADLLRTFSTLWWLREQVNCKEGMPGKACSVSPQRSILWHFVESRALPLLATRHYTFHISPWTRSNMGLHTNSAGHQMVLHCFVNHLLNYVILKLSPPDSSLEMGPEFCTFRANNGRSQNFFKVGETIRMVLWPIILSAQFRWL